METMVLRQGSGLAEVIWESGGGLGIHQRIVGDVCGQVSRWLVSFSDMKTKTVCLSCTNPHYIVLVGKLSRAATMGRGWYTMVDLN